MHIARTVEGTIGRAARSFPCLLVQGPRDCGKLAALAHTLGDNLARVSLDDLDERLVAQLNPKLFLDERGCPLIIEEIEKAPALLDEIKRRIDEMRFEALKSGLSQSLMYALTASTTHALLHGDSDSLAGRCAKIDMSSLSECEKLGLADRVFSPRIEDWKAFEASGKGHLRTRGEIFESIFQGGMPALAAGSVDRESYFKAYVASYVEQDAGMLLKASNLIKFRFLITAAAQRTAMELDYGELADAAGIDRRTCMR